MVGVGAWILVFHQPPPATDVLEWIVAAGEVVILPLAPLLPVLPMRGEHPEVLAADEFFKRPCD
jgi:hypothetical protein